MKKYVCMRMSNGSILMFDKNSLNGLNFNP